MKNEKQLKLLSAVVLVCIVAIVILTTVRKEEQEANVINEYPLSKVTILNTEIDLDDDHRDYSAIVDCKAYEENVQMINYKAKRKNNDVTVKSVFYKQDKVLLEPTKDMDRFDVNIDVKTETTIANYHFFVTCEGYNE